MKTRDILILSIFISLIALSLSQRLANVDETDAKISKIANKKNVGSLSGWVAMGAGIRSAATRGFPDLTNIIGGDSSQPKSFQEIALGLLSFFAGLIALIGFSVLFSVLSCCACPCFFCCRSCGACGGDKPDPKGYDKNQKLCAIITLAVGGVLIIIGFLIGLVSNSLVNQSVSETLLSINEAVDDATDFPAEIGKSLDKAIDELFITVDDVFEIIVSVPNEVIGPGGSLTAIVNNMTTTLRQLQPSFDGIVSNAKNLDSLITQLLAQLEQLSADAQNLTSIQTGLSADTTLASNNAIVYKMNATCMGVDQLPNIIVANASGLLPPLGDQISQIDVDLNSIADQIDSGFNSIRGNFSSIVDDAFKMIRSTVGNATSQAEDAFNGLLNSTTSTFGSVTDYQDQMNSFYEQNIKPNNSYRSSGMIVLFCLNLLVIILALVGFFVKKSPIMTAGICVCFFLMIFFWIVCLIHIIIATPVGKVCEIILENQVAELLEAVSPSMKQDLDNQLASLADSNSTFPNPLKGKDLSEAVEYVFDGLKSCRDGGNLITYLALDNVMDEQLAPLLDQAFSGFNFNDTLEGLEIPATGLGNIDLLDSLQLDTIIGQLETAKDDFDAYVNLIESIIINNTDTKTKDAKPIIDSANSDTVVDLCLEIVSGAPTVSERNEAIAKVRSDLTTYSNILNNMANVTIPEVRKNINYVRGNLTNLLILSQNITGNVEDVIDLVSGIDAQLQSIISGIKTKLISQTQFQVRDRIYDLVDTAKEIVIDLGDCKFLGEDVYALLNSICITSIGGLDATWYTSGYLGLMLIVAVVGIALTAKRWIRADPNEQDFGDDYYKDKNEFDLPPLYSSNDSPVKE